MLFRAGVADWRRRAHSLPCRYRDPDRRSDAHLLAFDGKGLGQAQDDRIGDSRQLFGLAHLRHDDLELVAAEAPDLSLVADALRQIGRAHVWTPVTNAHLVLRPLLAQKQTHTSQTTKKIKQT